MREQWSQNATPYQLFVGCYDDRAAVIIGMAPELADKKANPAIPPRIDSPA